MARNYVPHYLRPWVAGAREAALASAAKAATFALSEPELTEEMRRRILAEVCWAVTEVDGKYGTRFRSRGVLELVVPEGMTWQKLVQHEHVITRKSLIERLRRGEDPRA